MACRHFRGIKAAAPEAKIESVPGFNCEAFPDGIPAAIADGQVEHIRPYPGDRGIQFEPLGVDI